MITYGIIVVEMIKDTPPTFYEVLGMNLDNLTE